MMEFCIEVLTPEPSLRAEHGLLRDTALRVTADAGVAADRILDSAREEADAVLAAARAEASQAVRAAEQHTLERAQQLIQTLDAAQAAFLARAESVVLDLAQALFDRLVNETTPRERIAAVLKRLLLEAPPRLVTPLLRVNPEDVELLPNVEWDVKADAALARGTCRLEAASGEWCVDFDAAVAALKAALPGRPGAAESNGGSGT